MAVIVRDLCFSYKSGLKSKPTLNQVNMNVNCASIYSLLGPSGCGKTTLLSIIIGLKTAKSGTVHLYGYESGARECGVPGPGLGYMPQDIGLNFELTIKEILNYFGTIQMMTANRIKQESRRLIKLFNLPEKDRLIGKLSGGQKRLVSLAVSLIHKPRLLILDEPTVGVDPLLRTVIWNQLIDLSVNENVTTIVTTHYIDEAKRANVVAFMRKGEILKEGDPRQFMDAYNVSTLDEVFLTLCLQQGPRQQSFIAAIDAQESNEEQRISKMPIKRDRNVNWLQINYQITKSLFIKHMIESRRNPMTVLQMFFFTFMTIVTVKAILGSPPIDLKVAWVNDDFDPRNNCSEYSNQFESDTYLHCLPDVLRHSLNPKMIQLINYDSLHEALDSLQMVHIHAIIHLKRNFSQLYTFCDPFMNFDFGEDCNDNQTIANASITLYTDTTNPILADALLFSIFHSIPRFRKKVATMIGMTNLAHMEPPFQLEILSGDAVEENSYNFEQFTAPGFLIVAPFGFSAALCILTIIAERESDMSVRDYASGVRAQHILLAEIVARFLLLIFSTVINVFSMITIFGIPCRGSLTLVLLLSSMQVLLGITQGILFAALFTKSMLSFFTCAVVLVGSLLTTGAIWSVESQPVLYQWVNYILPFSHSIKSMRTLLLKQNATFHPQISMGFIMTSLYIAFNTVCSYLSLRYKFSLF